MDEKRAKKLGKYLRDRREALGLSSRQLQKLSGVPFPTITRLEQGLFTTPAPDKLARIAEALDLPLADIYLMAEYAAPKELPTPSVYLRAKFRSDLPPRELDKLSREVAAVLERHGLAADKAKRNTTKKPPKKGGTK